MAIVAVAGDACTTTAVALAASWPTSDDVVMLEADPSGGDLAAWFDMPVAPSLSTVVTRVLDGAWPEIERHTRLADNGIRLIPAPARAGEASQAIGESARSLVPTLATMRSPVAVVDTGRLAPVANSHPFVAASAVVVIVHRQAPQSARAAAVRLQRLVDRLDQFTTTPTGVVVAVVGATPFGHAEIERLVHESVGATPVVMLPVDDLAAHVLAGRTGVSARRLTRLPLMRAARELAAATERVASQASAGLWKSAR
jgi:MinD-like ATPase involved in chromosome partitioning or flagellar assembly